MNITVGDLHKSFLLDRGLEVKVLKGLSFSVRSGEKVAIVGPSGAGKSTLLHLLGLLDHPTTGTIAFDGTDAAFFDESQRSKIRSEKIGFLFQLHYLLPDFTVWENVLVPVWDRKKEKENDARALLESLGLSHRLSHMPAELSGGEQQRVAIARALINRPEVIMADEPTGNLDRETGIQVEDVLFNACAERKITLLLVTHNPDLAARADRKLKMIDGLLS